MGSILSGEAPKKKQGRYRAHTPKEYPGHYWVRWFPQCHGPVTAWYEICAYEAYDRTHVCLKHETGRRGGRYFLGQIGTSRLEFPSDEKLMEMPHPVEFLRERIIAESNRAKHFIDYVLKQNGVIIDDRWKWIWPRSSYFAMVDAPPFPIEGFRGGRYRGLKAPDEGVADD